MGVSVEFDFARVREPVFHYQYLHYFMLALRSQCSESVSIRPLSSRVLAPLIEFGVPGANRTWNAVYAAKETDCSGTTEYVRLTFTTRRGRQVKVVIDFWDAGDLTHPDALEWCDVYFKTNYWPTRNYPPKVLPLMNGNGLLSVRDLDALKAMRNAPHNKDLIHWAKIWEPGPAREYSAGEAREIVEHQIRLFEALSTLACDTDLIAVVPRNFATMRYDEVESRLASSGVRVQPDWGDIDTARLWEGLRSARIVFLRTGNHHSISWRLTELLSMGACVVYDGAPYPNWPVPLAAGVHYLDGKCQLTCDFVGPSPDRYTRLTDRVGRLLADDATQSALRRQAADYFDTYCAPEAVGAYILRCVEDHRTNG